VLDLSTADYLERSVDSLFVPLTVMALTGLVALWAHGVLRTRLAVQGPARRRLILATAVAGGLLSVAGFVSIFIRTWLNDQLGVPPLCFAGGVLLVAYANHLHRAGQRHGTATVAEWSIVFALVAIALFWAAGDYSAAVGTGRARAYARNLRSYPGVVVYSERRLSLRMAGVRETRCGDAKAAHPFRYDGLNLLLRSGDSYLLLPRTWTESQGRAILLPRSDSIRLEFTKWTEPEATC
jgi:hypothetical protein